MQRLLCGAQVVVAVACQAIHNHGIFGCEPPHGAVGDKRRGHLLASVSLKEERNGVRACHSGEAAAHAGNEQVVDVKSHDLHVGGKKRLGVSLVHGYGETAELASVVLAVGCRHGEHLLLLPVPVGYLLRQFVAAQILMLSLNKVTVTVGLLRQGNLLVVMRLTVSRFKV